MLIVLVIFVCLLVWVNYLDLVLGFALGVFVCLRLRFGRLFCFVVGTCLIVDFLLSIVRLIV